MSQTTMKIDSDLLIDLRNIAKKSYRSPQKHLRFLVDRELAEIESEDEASDIFVNMMDQLVSDSENNILTEEDKLFIQSLIDKGVPLFGENVSGGFSQYSIKN